MGDWRVVLGWKVQEFEVGDKVIPISKSVWNTSGIFYNSLDKSVSWQRAQEIQQPFLYICTVYPPKSLPPSISTVPSNTKIYACSPEFGFGGDYFLAEDLEPYYD